VLFRSNENEHEENIEEQQMNPVPEASINKSCVSQNNASLNKSNKVEETSEKKEMSPVKSTHSRSSSASSKSSSQLSRSASPVIHLIKKSEQSIAKEDNLELIRQLPAAVPDSVVLTHVIEGYVIKESSQPFPVKQLDADNTQIAKTSIATKIDNAKKKRNELVVQVEPILSEENVTKTNEVANTPPKSTSTPSNIKEPTAIYATKAAEVVNQCLECKSSLVKGDNKFCSNICMKRYEKKLLKVTPTSKKAKKCLENNTEKENNICNMSSKLLEDSNMSGDALNKSKSKHHKHHHHHHHHHHRSPSKAGDRNRDLNESNASHSDHRKQCNQSTDEHMDTDVLAPPPPQLASLTISSSPQHNLAFGFHSSSPQLPNPFGSTSLTLNNLTNSSSPTRAPVIGSVPPFLSNSADVIPQGDPAEWNYDQVFQFVKTVAGVHVAELFRSQEVDGSALSLIRDDHLVNTMQIKLGPALKIMNKFNELKNKFNNAN